MVVPALKCHTAASFFWSTLLATVATCAGESIGGCTNSNFDETAFLQVDAKIAKQSRQWPSSRESSAASAKDANSQLHTVDQAKEHLPDKRVATADYGASDLDKGHITADQVQRLQSKGTRRSKAHSPHRRDAGADAKDWDSDSRDKTVQRHKHARNSDTSSIDQTSWHSPHRRLADKDGAVDSDLDDSVSKALDEDWTRTDHHTHEHEKDHESEDDESSEIDETKSHKRPAQADSFSSGRGKRQHSDLDSSDSARRHKQQQSHTSDDSDDDDSSAIDQTDSMEANSDKRNSIAQRRKQQQSMDDRVGRYNDHVEAQQMKELQKASAKIIDRLPKNKTKSKSDLVVRGHKHEFDDSPPSKLSHNFAKDGPTKHVSQAAPKSFEENASSSTKAEDVVNGAQLDRTQSTEEDESTSTDTQELVNLATLPVAFDQREFNSCKDQLESYTRGDDQRFPQDNISDHGWTSKCGNRLECIVFSNRACVVSPHQLMTSDMTSLLSRLGKESLHKGSTHPYWKGKVLRVRAPVKDGFFVRAQFVMIAGSWAAANNIPFFVDMEEVDYDPVKGLGKSELDNSSRLDAYYDPSGPGDRWEQFFKAPLPMNMNKSDVYKAIPTDRIIELSGDTAWWYYQKFNTGKTNQDSIYPPSFPAAINSRTRRAEQVKSWVRPNDEILQGGNHLWKQIHPASAKKLLVLGVHLRGARQGIPDVPPSKFWPLIDRYIAANEPSSRVHIFFASDDAFRLDEALKRYGTRAFMQGKVPRSVGAIWKEGNTTLAHRKGATVLLDMLTLSKCDFLLKSASATSEFSTYFNPKLILNSIDLSLDDQPLPDWAKQPDVKQTDESKENNTDSASMPLEASSPSLDKKAAINDTSKATEAQQPQPPLTTGAANSRLKQTLDQASNATSFQAVLNKILQKGHSAGATLPQPPAVAVEGASKSNLASKLSQPQAKTKKQAQLDNKVVKGWISEHDVDAGQVEPPSQVVKSESKTPLGGGQTDLSKLKHGLNKLKQELSTPADSNLDVQEISREEHSIHGQPNALPIADFKPEWAYTAQQGGQPVAPGQKDAELDGESDVESDELEPVATSQASNHVLQAEMDAERAANANRPSHVVNVEMDAEEVTSSHQQERMEEAPKAVLDVRARSRESTAISKERAEAGAKLKRSSAEDSTAMRRAFQGHLEALLERAKGLATDLQQRHSIFSSEAGKTVFGELLRKNAAVVQDVKGSIARTQSAIALNDLAFLPTVAKELLKSVENCEVMKTSFKDLLSDKLGTELSASALADDI